MPTTCWSSVRACAARVTKVDNCGRPLPELTTKAYAVTKGFIAINYSPEVAEGEEIEVRNACGELCISDPGCPEIKWINLEIQFCNVDPDIWSIITGWPLVLDGTGNAVGNRIQRKITCDAGYALEAWSNIPGNVCEVGADKPYGYFLTPWINGGVIGDFSLQNDAATFTFTGRGQPGGGWGVGPWDVVEQATPGGPGPLLEAIGEDDAMHMQLTTIAPPTPACGALAMPAAA